MTREEAIIALSDRNSLLWGMSKEEQKYYSEALDMAIKALEQEPKTECDNCDYKEWLKGEQEPKTGHWIEHNDDHYDWIECSECGYGAEGEITSENGVRFRYCPMCGAKMEGGE